MSELTDGGKETKPINDQNDNPQQALDRRSALRRMALLAASATLGGAALTGLSGCNVVSPYSSYHSYGSYNSYSSYYSYYSYSSYYSYHSYSSYNSYSSYYYYAYYDGGYLAGYPSYGNYFT